jgi:hypothetical protein
MIGNLDDLKSSGAVVRPEFVPCGMLGVQEPLPWRMESETKLPSLLSRIEKKENWD